MKKVTVVTRTKNRPIFLKRAIESVHSQTYKEYVHVIVDDGGDDGVVQAVIDALEEDVKESIELFHRDVSSDAPDTIFNESIDRVNSDYFAIHDDDDTWHPEFLLQTVTHLERYKDKAAVVVSANKIIEGMKGNRIVQKKVVPWMADIKVINLYRQCIDNQFTPIATLFRRSSYEAVGRFDSTLPVVGDWEFGVRLLMDFDADFIDPGYPLANYHHRKKTGSSQDAVSSDDKHRYYTNLVMNRYLRLELNEGRIGVGYIMSQLKYNQFMVASVLRKVAPKRIIELIKRRASN